VLCVVAELPVFNTTAYPQDLLTRMSPIFVDEHPVPQFIDIAQHAFNQFGHAKKVRVDEFP